MVRQATVWDAQKIAELWGKLVDELGIEGRDGGIDEQERFYLNILVRIKKEDSCVVVIEDDENEIVGFASTDYTYYKYGTDRLVGLCDNIYINKEYRNKNLMNPMIDWMITYGKKVGMTEMQFETVYNPSLIKVWERKGFKPMQVKYYQEV
jgi:GNAT superfamily N-acetyltransferase